MGLIGGNGEDLPLKEDGKPLRDGLVMLRKKKEVFTFADVGERPVLSILRDFSAPVRLNASASDRETLTVIRSDSDLFNRWQYSAGLCAEAHRGHGESDRERLRSACQRALRASRRRRRERRQPRTRL